MGQFPGLMAPLGAARRPRRVRLARGEVPAGLRGTYLRNGPDARWGALFPNAQHWFDGDGMVHWVALDGGEDAEYGSAYVETQGFREEERAGKAKYCGLLQSPILPLVMWGFWSKLRNAVAGPDRPYWVIQQKNTANNGLVRTGSGRLLATYEAGSAYEIRLVREGGQTRLDTLGVYRPGGGRAEGDGEDGYSHWLHNFTAHSKVCPATGELIFISYDLIGKRFHVGVVGPDDSLRSLQTFEYPNGTSTMMHDFAITESRVLIMNHPLNFNLEQSMAGGVPFTYDKSAASNFGIIRRSSLTAAAGPLEPEIQWIEAENCYCYHTLAAFDDPEDSDLVHLYAHRTEETGGLGLATFKDASGNVAEALPGQSGRIDNPRLHRWCLRTGAGAQVVESRNECPFYSDFPEINPQFVGRGRVRFGYSLRLSETAAIGEVPLFDAVLKHDLERSTCEVLPLQEGRVAGDITFVPDAGRAGQEDGGWLLFMSHSLGGDKGWLEIIDCACFADGPVASFELPHVPIGFHSTWVPPEATAAR